MAIQRYLAMTAAEIAKNPEISWEPAWMACRFSQAEPGITNLPNRLTPGALLTLNDSVPIGEQDALTVAAQLLDCIRTFRCCALLLDFQRPNIPKASALIRFLLQALPCPVVVSEYYAQEFDCPVFLPPAPPSVPLKDHFAPWHGRKIWLDIGLEGEQITLTEAGAAVKSLPRLTPPDSGHFNEKLHCHYQIEVGEDAKFTLWRTREDLDALIAEADTLGVAAVVGLFQELHKFLPCQ